MLPVYYKNIIANKGFIKNFSDAKIDYVTGSRIINQKGNFRLYVYYDSLNKGSTMMTQFLYGDQSFVFNDAGTPEDILFNAVYLNTLDLNMQVSNNLVQGHLILSRLILSHKPTRIHRNW